MRYEMTGLNKLASAAQCIDYSESFRSYDWEADSDAITRAAGTAEFRIFQLAYNDVLEDEPISERESDAIMALMSAIGKRNNEWLNGKSKHGAIVGWQWRGLKRGRGFGTYSRALVRYSDGDSQRWSLEFGWGTYLSTDRAFRKLAADRMRPYKW